MGDGGWIEGERGVDRMDEQKQRETMTEQWNDGRLEDGDKERGR